MDRNDLILDLLAYYLQHFGIGEFKQEQKKLNNMTTEQLQTMHTNLIGESIYARQIQNDSITCRPSFETKPKTKPWSTEEGARDT